MLSCFFIKQTFSGRRVQELNILIEYTIYKKRRLTKTIATSGGLSAITDRVHRLQAYTQQLSIVESERCRLAEVRFSSIYRFLIVHAFFTHETLYRPIFTDALLTREEN